MSSTYYQLSDVPDTAPLLPCKFCGYGHGADTHNPLAHLEAGDPEYMDPPRAKPSTPRLATLQRELDQLQKRYYRAGSGSSRRRIEARIKAVTAAIAAHPGKGKG